MYRASGRYVSDDPKLGRLDGPVKIFSAFDFDADRLRFDRTEPIREGKIVTPGAGTQKTWAPKIAGGQLIQLKDQTISHILDIFQVRQGGLNPGAEASIKPLDVRGFGLFYWASLASYPATTYPQTLEYLEKEKPEEVVEERSGIWRIVWTFPEVDTVTARRTVWLDQKAGFSPIRMELKYRATAMPAGQWKPTLESETTWAEVAGVWVPRTDHVVASHSAPTMDSYELSFDWEMVNGVVPPETFTLAGLKLKPGYQVVDNSLGREIVVGKVGKYHALVETPQSPPPPTRPDRSWRGWSPSLPYLLAGVGAVAIGVAFWFRFGPPGRQIRPS